MDENLSGGRFHQHLREIFAPQVVRYVDLMEASIAQSLQKGFEKEKWEVKGKLRLRFQDEWCTIPMSPRACPFEVAFFPKFLHPGRSP